MITTNSTEHGTRKLKNIEGFETIDVEDSIIDLKFIKQNGRQADDHFSKEDQNEVQPFAVDNNLLTKLTNEAYS